MQKDATGKGRKIHRISKSSFFISLLIRQSNLFTLLLPILLGIGPVGPVGSVAFVVFVAPEWVGCVESPVGRMPVKPMHLL